jgi:ribonuclease D
MEPITTTDPLAQACARLAQHPYVTIDTEFLRESTYYPILCVMQLASPDEALVVDALAPDIDLAPFFALMADERVLKVFHAGRQDIEIIWHRAGLIPHPVFDTQIAAMVLGHGDSISYEQLVQRITGDHLDKSHRFTDWSRRPLSKAQIAYAISDVTHLRDIYLALSADLERRGRTEWVNEEMEILTSPDTYRSEPESAWQRVRTRARKPKELAVLMEVAAWREREAPVLERERLLPEQLPPPALERGDVGLVVGRDPFEIVDGSDHLGGDRVALGGHAQQHLEQFDDCRAVDRGAAAFDSRQRFRIARQPARHGFEDGLAPFRPLEPPRQGA